MNIVFGRQFPMSFVPAPSGVQTAEPVNGRRALPRRNGPQPKAGETWLVVLPGENCANRSVYFLTCLQLIAGATADSSSADRDLAAVEATVQLGQRARLLLSSATAASDDQAMNLRSELQTVVRHLDGIGAACAQLVQQQQDFTKPEIDNAKWLFGARRTMALLKAEEVSLRTELRSHARLSKRVKTEADRASAAAVQAVLDDRHKTLVADMAAADAELNGPKYGFVVRYGTDVLYRLLQILTEEHNLAEQRLPLNERLTVAICAYETRLSELK